MYVVFVDSVYYYIQAGRHRGWLETLVSNSYKDARLFYMYSYHFK